MEAASQDLVKTKYTFISDSLVTALDEDCTVMNKVEVSEMKC